MCVLLIFMRLSEVLWVWNLFKKKKNTHTHAHVHVKFRPEITKRMRLLRRGWGLVWGVNTNAWLRSSARMHACVEIVHVFVILEVSVAITCTLCGVGVKSGSSSCACTQVSSRSMCTAFSWRVSFVCTLRVKGAFSWRGLHAKPSREGQPFTRSLHAKGFAPEKNV